MTGHHLVPNRGLVCETRPHRHQNHAEGFLPVKKFSITQKMFRDAVSFIDF